MNKFSASVFKAIKQYNMLCENDKVLIALSGGKDSVALFLFLAEYANFLKIQLYAAHVNHMIRGVQADKDQLFCENLCQDYGIKLYSGRFDVPVIAKEVSLSVEEAARNVRYEYFNKLCAEHGINKIATAHTASDNTETVIYNIVRGTGTKGICGIPPIRDNIIRPLILCTKEQTAEYCNIKNTHFCDDVTNGDDAYDRNNIRLNIIPHLKRRNPSIDASTSRLSYIARCDRMLIKSIADDFLQKHNGELPLDETAGLFNDEKMLSCAHEILCRKCGFLIPFDIFMQCRSVIISKNIGKHVKLHDNVYMVVEYGKISFKSAFTPLPYYQTELEYGKTVTAGGKVTITLENEKNAINYKNINNLTKTATFNFDKIYGNIFARKKKDGDAYISGGMSRSVKKFFSDSKISREKREFIPVICDEKGIIWVPGMRVCDRVAAHKDGNNITIIVEFTE